MDMQYNIDIQKSLLQNVCFSGLLLKNRKLKLCIALFLCFCNQKKIYDFTDIGGANGSCKQLPNWASDNKGCTELSKMLRSS